MPTLSFSPATEGWPSRYSYNPEFMMGMNNQFYTFNRGNIYRHNSNAIRNEYYGTQYPSYVKTVFNQQPLENKLFKTINIEGTDNWNIDVTTDIQTGSINDNWFEKKEGAFFAYIRYNDEDPIGIPQFPQRSINGIGKASEITIDGVNKVLTFTPPTYVDDIISIGDVMYEVTNILESLGTVVGIDKALNQIVVQTGAAITTATNLAYVKNNVAESHGVLGHYCIVEMTNTNTYNSELFAVESEVMKSFP
jgi:hypothetical protein